MTSFLSQDPGVLIPCGGGVAYVLLFAQRHHTVPSLRDLRRWALSSLSESGSRFVPRCGWPLLRTALPLAIRPFLGSEDPSSGDLAIGPQWTLSTKRTSQSSPQATWFPAGRSVRWWCLPTSQSLVGVERESLVSMIPSGCV